MTDAGSIPAAHSWPTNGALIADVAAIHLDDSMVTMDVTYGRGLWWTQWRPPAFVAHDRALDGVDFRRLPEPPGVFELVAFDPPYISMGGRVTSNIQEYQARYGLHDAPASPAAVQADIDAGLHEVHRVLRRKGIALVKCQDYVSSGKLWIGEHLTLTTALGIGFEVVDRFYHLNKRRLQPQNRTRKLPSGETIASRQQHGRGRPSVLFVLRKKT